MKDENKQETYFGVEGKTKGINIKIDPLAFITGAGVVLMLTSIVKLKKDQINMAKGFVKMIHNDQLLAEAKKATEHLIRKES